MVEPIPIPTKEKPVMPSPYVCSECGHSKFTVWDSGHVICAECLDDQALTVVED